MCGSHFRRGVGGGAFENLDRIWGTAVFRPLGTDPKITQALNDLGYITFLFTAPPFSLWAGTLAFAIFHDQGARPVYPRWLGYLSAWVAVLIFPAGLVIFFKTGPFAWNGLMALYVPAAAFFAWLVSITWCTIQNLRAGRHDHDPALVADCSGAPGSRPQVR